MLPPHLVDLLQVSTLLVGQTIVQLLDLRDEAILLVLGQLRVPLVLLGELTTVLLGQRFDLSDEVVLLLLEGVRLPILVVFELAGVARLLLLHLFAVLLSDGLQLRNEVLFLFVIGRI